MGKRYERGGASLFVVIFVTVIITILTVSFTALMIKNQQQTSANDLSERAYDSSMAGVEDAKRVLVAMKTACAPGGDVNTCTTLTNILSQSASSQNCATLRDAGITNGVKTSNGAYLETEVGNASDNQAYTCVTVDLKTPDYKDSLTADKPTVIPLVSDPLTPFNSVKVSWFTRDDASAAGQTNLADNSVHYYNNVGDTPLPQDSNWGSAPSLMRAQYIPGSGNASTLTTDAKTLFLYPQHNGVAQASFNLDSHDSSMKAAKPIIASCQSYAPINGACSMTMTLPVATTNAYLQLTPLYNATHVTVELYNSATLVDFNGVQPLVDSNGRASNLFRRVAARVKVSEVSLPYPEGAIDVHGNLCKVFTLVDNNGNAYNPGNCNP